MAPSKRNPATLAAGRASKRNFAAANFQFEDSLLPLNLQERPRARTRDANAEARIQAAIVAWVRLVAPDLLIFAVPNGGLRSKAEAARLKWTGTVAGVPDLAIVSPGARVNFIEVKTATGRLSPDQRAIHDALIALGTPPAICRSIDDARNAFRRLGSRDPGGAPMTAAPTQTIAERLGAKLKRVTPHEFAGPCLVCGGRDRFSVNAGKNVWNCRGCSAGGDAIDLVRHVLGVGYASAFEIVNGERIVSSRPATRSPAPRDCALDDTGATRTKDALALWEASLEPRGTLAEVYLAFRGLDLGDDVAGDVIRWHPGVGAMLGLFRDIGSNRPQAISRTFLDREGRKIGRKFLGPVGGAAIKLDPDENVLGGLHVAEGIESAMAARQMGFCPAWALGSAGAIASLPVLAGVESLTILAENDEANARAVAQVGQNWTSARREVLVARSLVDSDMNDALKRRSFA